MTEKLTSFTGRRTVALTTFKRDGDPVSIPVHIVVDGERAFIRTFDAAWKVKRMRRDPTAEIAPSPRRRKPAGPAVKVRTRLLGAEEAALAARMLRRKYPLLQGFLVPLVHRVKRYRTLHYELTSN